MLVNYSPMQMHLCIFSHYMFNHLLLLNFVYMLCLFAFFLILLYSSYMEEIKKIIYRSTDNLSVLRYFICIGGSIILTGASIKL